MGTTKQKTKTKIRAKVGDLTIAKLDNETKGPDKYVEVVCLVTGETHRGWLEFIYSDGKTLVSTSLPRNRLQPVRMAINFDKNPWNIKNIQPTDIVVCQ